MAQESNKKKISARRSRYEKKERDLLHRIARELLGFMCIVRSLSCSCIRFLTIVNLIFENAKFGCREYEG